jgi:NAD(P)-dependent dehydrogenase (short-subunit alcohol dehydrogenase family)
MMPNQSGENILVVGGAKGIGRETCRMLLATRCRLIVFDNDATALATLTPELNSEHATFTVDMTDRVAVSKALQWLNEHVGKLNAVVICAAVHGTYPAEFMPDDLIEKFFDVNLIAHIKLVRDLLPLVKDGGKIIGVSSNCADIGIPMESVYAASKAGLERFYEGLSIEISYRKIRPIVIHPGNVNTGFNETGNAYTSRGNDFVDAGYQRIVEAIDSRHGIAPQVVAHTIVRALSAARPRFRYMVGLNAVKAHWAKRLLGTRLALRLMAKLFGFRFYYDA